MPQKLLDAFRDTFSGKQYRHRSSTHGDRISSYLYEDLYDLGHAKDLVQRADAGDVVYNRSNRVVGRHKVRRGDGLLGQAVPGEKISRELWFSIPRGKVANIQIGTEVKIISTAQARQIDRAVGDIKKQHGIFKKVSPDAISVAIIGVNHSPEYRSFEGDDRYYDSSPGEEAETTMRWIERDRELHDMFDEVLVLPFRATNLPPHPFSWVRGPATVAEYNAALVRLSNIYRKRF